MQTFSSLIKRKEISLALIISSWTIQISQLWIASPNWMSKESAYKNFIDDNFL